MCDGDKTQAIIDNHQVLMQMPAPFLLPNQTQKINYRGRDLERQTILRNLIPYTCQHTVLDFTLLAESADLDVREDAK